MSFCVWLFCLMHHPPFSSILPQMAKFLFFFLWISNIPHCLFYSSIDGYLSWLHVLILMNKSRINLSVHKSFDILVSFPLGIISVRESHIKWHFYLVLLWNFSNTFHTCCTNFHSHQRRIILLFLGCIYRLCHLK